MGCLEGCAVGVIKYILFFANILFVLSGIAIIVAGAMAQANFSDYHGLLQGKFSGGAIFLIVVGAIIFIIAFFGCCGAIQENRCMLITYGTLLLCVFIAEMALGIWALSSPSAGNEVFSKDEMTKFWKSEYNSQNHSSVTFDLLQKDLTCCGVNGPQDYVTQLGVLKLPKSCCTKENNDGPLGCHALNAHKNGCFEAFTNFINMTFNVIGVVAITVACIEVLAIIFAFCLAGRYRD